MTQRAAFAAATCLLAAIGFAWAGMPDAALAFAALHLPVLAIGIALDRRAGR